MKSPLLHLVLALALLLGFLVVFTLMIEDDSGPVANARGYVAYDANGSEIEGLVMAPARSELGSGAEGQPTPVSPPPEEPLPDTRIDLVEGPLLRTYHENGRLHKEGQQVSIEGGLWERQGSWTQWHENGEVEELGAYSHGSEDGVWQWWHPNGERWCEGEWDEGKRIGAWSFWYDDGQVQMVAHYENGEGHGSWISFHPDGTKAAEGGMMRGELHGPWTVWHEDGTIDLERTGTFQYGEKIGD